MTVVVVDASAFVKGLVEEPGTERFNRLACEADFIAPDHLLVETANVLWKLVRWRGLPCDIALDKFTEAERYPVTLTPSVDLLQEALPFASELPLSLYDTLYLLLALKGGRALVTADARMREAAEALGIRVEWVGASA